MSYLDEEQMKLLLAFLEETFPIEASTNNEGYPFDALDNVLPQLESEFSGSIEGFGVGATQGVESSQQPQQANDQYLDPVEFEPEPLTREEASHPHFDNFDEEPEPALFNLSNDNADSPQAPDALPYSHRTTTLHPLHLETVSTPGLSTGTTSTPIDRPLLTPVEDILPTSSTFLSAIDGALDDLKPFNRRSEKRKRLSEEADVSSNPVAASYDSRTIDPNDIFLPPIATPENFSVYYPDRRAGRATASPKADVATISHYQNQLGGNIPMGLYPFPPPAPIANSASTSSHGQNRSRSDWINTKKSQVPTQVECQWKDPRDPQASPCGFAITSTDCAEHHLRTAHGEDSDLQRRVCHWDGCGREFTSGWFFRHFHRSHHPYNRVYCDSCEKGFQDHTALQNHIAKNHSLNADAVAGDLADRKKRRRVL